MLGWLFKLGQIASQGRHRPVSNFPGLPQAKPEANRRWPKKAVAVVFEVCSMH